MLSSPIETVATAFRAEATEHYSRAVSSAHGSLLFFGALSSGTDWFGSEALGDERLSSNDTRPPHNETKSEQTQGQ